MRLSKIEFIKDGPAVIYLAGELASHKHFIDVEGSRTEVETTEEDKVLAICRCGKSSNYPYCDGSHKSIP